MSSVDEGPIEGRRLLLRRPEGSPRSTGAPNYIPGAIVGIIVFFPLGIAALVAALKTRSLDRQGRAEEARLSAERARNLVWYAVGIGLTVLAIFFLIALVTLNDGAVRKAFGDGPVFRGSLGKVIDAFGTNVSLFVVTELIVLVWALVIAIIRSLPGAAAAPVRWLAIAYADIFRGLPAVIVIYVVEFGFKRAGLPIVKDFSDFQSGVLALTLVYGAYVSEVYRSGIESIHWSQVAAARSLGLSYGKTMRHVIVPQAVRRIVPPLLNDFIGLQKDTALVSFIGTIEAFNYARNRASLIGNLTPITGVALCFLVITIPMARLTDWLIRRDQQRMRASGG